MSKTGFEESEDFSSQPLVQRRPRSGRSSASTPISKRARIDLEDSSSSRAFQSGPHREVGPSNPSATTQAPGSPAIVIEASSDKLSSPGTRTSEMQPKSPDEVQSDQAIPAALATDGVQLESTQQTVVHTMPPSSPVLSQAQTGVIVSTSSTPVMVVQASPSVKSLEVSLGDTQAATAVETTNLETPEMKEPPTVPTLQELTPISNRCKAMLSAQPPIASRHGPLLTWVETFQQFPMTLEVLRSMEQSFNDATRSLSLEEQTYLKASLDECIATCQSWANAHSKVVALEAKHSWLIQDSARLCDQVQQSEDMLSADQQSYTALMQELAAAEALVASLKSQIASFQFREPTELLGCSTLDVKTQLEEASANVPRLKAEITQSKQLMTSLFEKQVQKVQEIQKFIHSRN